MINQYSVCKVKVALLVNHVLVKVTTPTVEYVIVQLFVTDAKCWFDVVQQGVFEVVFSNP